MDYAMKRGISLSTLRRHIKAKKLTYKIEDGRYLLWDGDSRLAPSSSASASPPSTSNLTSTQEDGIQGLETRLQKLTHDLKKAQEEIAELKTLIAFYEERSSHQRFNL